MLKEERQERILEILEEENYITANKLAKTLYASLPTIRRDLNELARKELIIRNHGGAKKVDSEKAVMPVEFRKTINYKQKRKLCEKASSLIKDNSLIFIDASTTTLQMTEYLNASSQITVVTNSLLVSTILTKKGIKNFLTGGEMQQNSMCYAGVFAENFIRQFNFNLAFFSCHGVDENNNIVDTSLAETSLRRILLSQTDKSIFLCDSSKFGAKAPYNLTNLNEIDVIVTDKLDLNLQNALLVK
ncbi:MAG: DeoR/GlpR transcriptional regulator [Clostridia bacterium]|nr:DeoR/GlpR transcriptional regulator [Clostridia bacterium]